MIYTYLQEFAGGAHNEGSSGSNNWSDYCVQFELVEGWQALIHEPGAMLKQAAPVWSSHKVAPKSVRKPPATAKQRNAICWFLRPSQHDQIHKKGITRSCEICMISERLRIRHWMTAQHTSIHLWGSFPHSSWEFGRFTRKIAQTRRNEKLQSWKEQVDLFAPSTCTFAAMARTLCCLGFEAGALWMSNS
jgi:hypothetical protein